VNDLLSTIPVQNIDWSIALQQDIVTVDGFVESILGHNNSAFVDSGLQVSDSAVFSDTPPKTVPPSATDDLNDILYDDGSCATCGDDGTSASMKKCVRVVAESAVCGHHAYVQDTAKHTKKSSSYDDRPKQCSVAVNTSFYWPPADDGRTEKWHNSRCGDTMPLHSRARSLNSAVAGCNDNTALNASDIAVQSNRGYATDYSPSAVSVSQQLLVSDQDTEPVNGTSPGTCDSMADVSVCTPPPPMFPNPSEESVVSEMIMDMPEYTALSLDK